MRRKRGKFMTFIYSLIPGAAEMYMGFMKQGISLMAMFFLCFVIPSVLRVSDVFILFAVLVWFYSFFHARNLASCDDETFGTLQDDYVWTAFLAGNDLKITHPAVRKWGAVALIVYGVTQLWNSISNWCYYLIPDRIWEEASIFVDDVPEIVVALVIIIVGCKLIAGKKEELHGEE